MDQQAAAVSFPLRNREASLSLLHFVADLQGGGEAADWSLFNSCNMRAVTEVRNQPSYFHTIAAGAGVKQGKKAEAGSL